MNVEYENLKVVNNQFRENIMDELAAILDSGWFILGERVKSFEGNFASYCGSKYCVGVASGLDALILSLLACGFEKGSKIIVPSNTYIATILAVIHAGLKPVLVEPDLQTYNINPERLEEAINAKTRAILCVHLYGKTCEMDTILSVCKKYNLKLIEDCAQAHGAKYKGRMVGSFGDAGAYSFYPTKNLGALGDAGAVITSDEGMHDKVRMLRHYGQNQKYYNEVIGYNSRLDELQAGILLIKLKYLDEITKHKKKLAEIYHRGLKNDFIKPVVDPNFSDVHHIYPIRHPKRDSLREYLLSNGIKTEIHYPVPPHFQIAMKEHFAGKQYPISEEIHNTILSLPISFGHREEEIEYVVEVMNKF
ncbi:MAG: DegT/DnrJ/EryC1/StrS family aminotransferase [Ignavibacteriales bacterium]|nr:DegT/DnrJ/EryC1/StrS family aminotransferase [Ignavibacteriales bacterium]